MTLEAFSLKWFALYYPVLGLLMLLAGGWLLIRPSRFSSYLVKAAEQETPPPMLRSLLKYWFLFTLPCLLLAFIPISWSELLFSVWSLVMVYLIGSQLVRWPQIREVIPARQQRLPAYCRWLGVITVSSATVILMLGYLKIQQLV